MQYTLLKQSAVQNKISRAKSSFGKFGKISTSGKKPTIRYLAISIRILLNYTGIIGLDGTAKSDSLLRMGK